jgi:D-alanine-D-alanine ligase
VQNTHYKKRVAVLRGGPSSEYDVSMNTGVSVIKTLSHLPYSIKEIVVTKNGEWLVNGFVRQPIQALLDVDVVFNALHGTYGEDGSLQRVLEPLALPFTGSSSYVSALTVNKFLAKEYLKKNQIDVLLPPHMKVSKQEDAGIMKITQTITDLFGPEYVVKPINGGSSIGIAYADQSNLYTAISRVLNSCEQVLVEKRIIGKEATVGILENFREQKYYQLPAAEICLGETVVGDTNTPQILCPGRFSKIEKEKLAKAAKDIHQIFNLQQYSASDFIVATDGIYFLETNSLPKLSEESSFVSALNAVGGTYSELLVHLIETATYKVV